MLATIRPGVRFAKIGSQQDRAPRRHQGARRFTYSKSIGKIGYIRHAPPGRPARRPAGHTGPATDGRQYPQRQGEDRGIMTRIAVVTGNPKPASRTHSVALSVAGALAKELPAAAVGPVVDLADYAPRLFDTADEELTALTAQVAAAGVAVFASPTYKAAYTGLLKAFLDRYGNNGLAGVAAVPVMTGGWPGHLLAVEVHLRPVLVELGATVPARGLYVTEPELADVGKAVAAWSGSAFPLIKAAIAHLRQPERLVAPPGAPPGRQRRCRRRGKAGCPGRRCGAARAWSR